MMNKKILIEICVDNAESALSAQKGGADRIELCSELGAGGLTPSKGLIEYLTSNLQIPVFVMIRPRSGDFLFSRAEFQIMKADIFAAKVAGAAGIVTGMLNSNSTIDTCRMKEIIDCASPLPVTFHRAFDMVQDQIIALEELIELGCSRVLTSGGSISAYEGRNVITELNNLSQGRIIIMPGAGVNAQNISELIETTKCNEFHLSASSQSPIKVKNYNEPLESVFPPSYRITDNNKVEEVCRTANPLTN
jgi:copper homeostasis protein